MNLKYRKLSEAPQYTEAAAGWFSSKWEVPREAYQESIEQGVKSPARIPQWYIVLNEEQKMIAGMGIIENDFHERKDLTPNICALYVEPQYRRNGIARQLLNLGRREAGLLGFSKIYLVTDHRQFYETCGWEFLMMVREDEGQQIRMYAADTN